jgi:hypothetical protein
MNRKLIIFFILFPMQMTKEIDQSTLNKIFTEYRKEHGKEVMEFYEILSDLKENLNDGEKLIMKRYNKLCLNIENKLDTYLNKKTPSGSTSITATLPKQFGDDVLTFIPYSNESLIIRELNTCRKLINPYFVTKHEKLKNVISSLKMKERKMAEKCIVLEFSENDIKNCLYNKFSKLRHKMTSEIREYYQSLDKFKNNKFYL